MPKHLLTRATLIACVAAACLVAGGSFWWRSGRAERHLDAAEEALRAGDADEALARLAVPEAAPKTRERALLVRAGAYLERGDLARAVEALDGVDPHGPNGRAFAYWKGRVLYAAGQPLLAMGWLNGAWKARPDDAEAARWLAAAAYDVGDRATTAAALEAVARLEPEDPRVWRTLGLIARENVDYEAARDALERSIRNDKAQPSVRLELAEVLLKLGDAAAASKQLDACRGFVPAGRHAALRAESLRVLGDVEGLRLAVAEGLDADPDDPDLIAEKARIEIADGHPDRALVLLDRALGIDPYRADALYQRALVHRRLGHGEESQRDFDRAAALNRGLAELSALNEQAARDATDPDVRHKLGQVCESLGKVELAASWYRAALACDPDHRPSTAALDALRAAKSLEPRVNPPM